MSCKLQWHGMGALMREARLLAVLVSALALASSACAQVIPGSNVVVQQSGAGSVQTTVQDDFSRSVSVKQFGAVGDGVTDDAAALTAALSFASLTRRNLNFENGIYAISSTIVLSGSPVAFIGAHGGSLQQGSTLPAVTLRWIGGATPMFDAQSSGWRFSGLAIENRGAATDFMYSISAQHLLFEDCSFLPATGTTRFSRSIFYSFGNAYGYSKFKNTNFQGSAPVFMLHKGNGSFGVTSLEFDGGLVESNGLGSVTFVKLDNVGITNLTIKGMTFNQQASAFELTVLDTIENAWPVSVNVFNFENNEFDIPAASVGDRHFKLKNVPSARFVGNYFTGGGSAAYADLINSTVTDFASNYVGTLNGPFFSTDSTSRVHAGLNAVNTPNAKGIVNGTAAGSGIIPIPIGALGQQYVAIVDGSRSAGSGAAVYSIDVNTAALASVGVVVSIKLDNENGGFQTRGQIITLLFKNTSGQEITGGITPASAAYFKLAGGAFPVPANGNSRAVTFVWDGAAFIEISRGAADAPN